jgi:hypothetical protein
MPAKDAARVQAKRKELKAKAGPMLRKMVRVIVDGLNKDRDPDEIMVEVQQTVTIVIQIKTHIAAKMPADRLAGAISMQDDRTGGSR